MIQLGSRKTRKDFNAKSFIGALVIGRPIIGAEATCTFGILGLCGSRRARKDFDAKSFVSIF